MEIIKTFDANHVQIGEADRTIVHTQGLWHETFHCWFVAELSGTPCVLIQLRSPLKLSFPNLLDRLVPLGIRIDAQDEASGSRNREFAHVFLYRDDRPLLDYALQQEEVSALLAIPIKQGLALLFGEQQSVTCEGIRFDDDGALVTFETDVTTADFIPLVDGYYRKVFVLADLHFHGYRYLSI